MLLCNTCHAGVHGGPFEARSEGFIVSAHSVAPYEHVVQSWFGSIFLNCDGTYRYLTDTRERSIT